MAPVGAPRQAWMWSLPALVFLLSFVWYKRKRNTLRTDPGGTPAEFAESAEEIEPQCEDSTECQESVNLEKVAEQDLSEDLEVEQEKSIPPLVRCESTYEPDSTVIVEKVDKIEILEVEEPIVQSDKVIDCEAVPKQAKAQVIKEEVKEVVAEKKSVSVTESNITSTMKGSEREVAAPVVALKETKTDDAAVDKVDALEDKLASLALDSSEAQRRGAERDSANHSPVDAMLASPSMSSYSDEHSEGSSDSGKGCSDVASPPSRTPVGSGSLVGDGDSGVDASNGLSVYEFLLPQLLVGRLIGRHGQFVHEIKAKTNASILIKKHPETPKQKICAIEGTQMDIDNALAMIRDRFPPRKYPNVTLEQVAFSPAPTLVPDFCQLHLVEGVNNEVMISSLVSPAHMFVQQPYHPSYQFLTRLNVMMNSVYTQVEAPNLPDPIEVGNICVAPAVDGWYRAQVVATDEESQTSEIKFVDYGGYMSVNNSVLRQIRQDFMTLPFQATECYLANIKPTGETGEWSLDALRIVEELTRGQMLLVQVYDYAADNVPLIYLYSSVNSQLVLINQELVARGMAELDDTAGTGASSEAASLVVAAAAAVGMASAASTTADSNSSKSECEDKSSTIVSSSQANPPQVTAN